MSYTAIIKLEGETDIKVCFNPEPKPEFTTSRDFPSALEYWEQNRQYISFYSKEEVAKVLKHIGNWDNLKFGIEVDCIKIKTKEYVNDFIYGGKVAFFSPPKETTESEDYLEEYSKLNSLELNEVRILMPFRDWLDKNYKFTKL